MPPRGTPQARGGPARGGPPPSRGRGRGVSPGTIQVGLPAVGAHITTVGVKRPNFGTAGRPVRIIVNSFETTIPTSIICHYDVVISPSENSLPQRMTMDLINQLQSTVAPHIFTPPVVYDGRKNIFAARELGLGPTGSKEFDVILPEAGPPDPTRRPPRVYKIRLTKVAEINPEVLQRFIEGNQSHDNSVIAASQALNVVIRMEPIQRYPFNIRSFFTDQESRSIGGGLEVWRGYFQSVRPGIGRMLINVDISTGMMYKPGPLIDLALDFFNKPRADPNMLDPTRGMPSRERLRFSRFINGMRITTRPAGSGASGPVISRTVKKVSEAGANRLTFTLREGGTITVAEYYRRQNQPLRFPGLLCIEVGSGALIPFELCSVPKGQIVRKQIPPEKTKDVLTFATKKPQDRLQSITKGLSTLNYGQSEYVRQFGMNVDTSGPLSIEARVLRPPTLEYGGKQTITPRNGLWNMVDKKFYRPATVNNWVIIIFEPEQRCSKQDATRMAQSLVSACKATGMTVTNPVPIITHANGQGKISEHLRLAGVECKNRNGDYPNLIVVILPDGSNEIYTAVKHFGDCVVGIATQCLKVTKCVKGNPQYWANVILKINVKLGGINVIPDQASVAALVDPNHPTIVMGADVIHPAPGSEGRPSFTALVANLDSNAAKYAATTRVQASRREIIDDLGDMVKYVVGHYFRYQLKQEGRTRPVSRIIFYRDGVSEGQFQQVLDQELPALKGACAELKINPKITMIVVGKRHHVRLFPQDTRDADNSGNCPAGTVVDTGIAHPTEFDFYLQSHAGLLGTSRSAHYSVLHDENNFKADNLQSLSFALCHVYARSTRSVSIPAPVYYADIVCARAKNHYDPNGGLRFDDAATVDSSGSNQTQSLETFKRNFKALHVNQQSMMYFS